MLRFMRKRTPAVRFVALLWAALQLASPGVSAIADGIAAGQSASASLSHVESTTTSSCPEIHAVDCAVCRYLSNAAAAVPGSSGWLELSVILPRVALERASRVAAARSFPRGRAPPTL
jgi:hypothetical protein